MHVHGCCRGLWAKYNSSLFSAPVGSEFYLNALFKAYEYIIIHETWDTPIKNQNHTFIVAIQQLQNLKAILRINHYELF